MMCLYTDDSREYDLFREGLRRARQEHTCLECTRVIESGETYRFWVIREWDDDRVVTQKMCAHCWGTIALGSSLTGCPESWFWDHVHDLNEDMGFVGDILTHDLPLGGRAAMLRTVVGRRAKWRNSRGLLPIPSPERQSA